MAPDAGYSGTPLPRKLGIKPGDEVAVLGGPPSVAGRLSGLPGVGPPRRDLSGSDPLDVIVFFVIWRAELETRLASLRERMAPAGGLWVAWPKRAARVPTDMTEDVVRDVALPTGLVDNKVCAIDEVWSGLRLVIRRELRPPAAGRG
ncbi:MAG TPA: hypothetical protein VKD66_08760 [Streptosporangiaceae bacterium]|nr:hypothetical protein [Streptosporangiaceae bacterium]